jgi:hypothetical protein
MGASPRTMRGLHLYQAGPVEWVAIWSGISGVIMMLGVYLLLWGWPLVTGRWTPRSFAERWGASTSKPSCNLSLKVM